MAQTSAWNATRQIHDFVKFGRWGWSAADLVPLAHNARSLHLIKPARVCLTPPRPHDHNLRPPSHPPRPWAREQGDPPPPRCDARARGVGQGEGGEGGGEVGEGAEETLEGGG